jgi:hypothetical protein
MGPWDVFVHATDINNGAGYESALVRNESGLLGNDHRLVELPSVGIGVRWRRGL